MKTSQLSALLSSLVLGSLVACAPKSADLSSPTKAAPEKRSSSAGVSAEVQVQPKVDILFVIDTSESMEKHQEKLKTNIDRFAEAFKSHTNVDFHIGVVSIWDSRRYGNAVPAPYPLGKLRPLKDPAHPGEPVAGAAYVTRTERFSEILGHSLKLGIESRYAHDAKGKIISVKGVAQDGGGPEFEDLFSPVIPALSEQNGDFYRADAHLAVIMLTDADDQSYPSITPSALFQQLVDKKGGNFRLISVFGALPLEGCATDNYLKGDDGSVSSPDKILQLIQLTEGKAMNLCSQNYGNDLAEVGRIIEAKATRVIQIPLDSVPADGTIVVRYSGSPEPLKVGEDWAYDKKQNKIQIRGDRPVFQNSPNGKLTVEYVPIDWERVRQGN